MHSSNQKLVKVNPVPFMFGSFFRQRDKFPVKVLCTSMIILELTCIWSKVLWKYYCLVASLQTYCSYFSKREESHIYVKKKLMENYLTENNGCRGGIMLHYIKIWLLSFWTMSSDADCRKTNMPRYKYFGLF